MLALWSLKYWGETKREEGVWKVEKEGRNDGEEKRGTGSEVGRGVNE